MTAITLIDDLRTRGFVLQPEDGLLIVSPSSMLTDADREAIRRHKAELLKLLARPKPGTITRPMPVRGHRMPSVCLWDRCDGDLIGKGNLYRCLACNCYFELLPPEPPGIPVEFTWEDLMGGGATQSKCVN